MSYASKKAARLRTKLVAAVSVVPGKKFPASPRWAGAFRVIERFTAPATPPEAWAEDDWTFSASPRPCQGCRNTRLHLIETAPATDNLRHVVAVRCPVCGARGPDNCHGRDHACRRWNWAAAPRARPEQESAR